MTTIIDTIPAFEAFAEEASLESPVFREKLWRERYEKLHPDVFEGYYATQETQSRPPRMVRELSALRRRVGASADVQRQVIDAVGPRVAELLDAPSAPAPAPVHVLLVGNGATNATVGRLNGEVAVFHCLEWTQAAAPAEVLTAHELTHAWHRIILGGDDLPGDDDLAWLVFFEGVAIQASRAAAPDRPEPEYFWYGLPGFDTWPAWCGERRDALRTRLGSGLDGTPEAAEMFTGHAADEPPRTGYFVADDLVATLERRLADLVRLTVGDARATVRAALGTT